MSKQGQHVIPLGVYLGIGGTLLVMTIVTIAVSYVELGFLNIVVALAIVSTKALLVAFFFMLLYYDNKLYFFIFASSLFFLTVLISITMFDTLCRGDIYNYRSSAIQPDAKIYTLPTTSTAPADSSRPQ